MKKFVLALTGAILSSTLAYASVEANDLGVQRSAEIAKICAQKGEKFIPHDARDIERLGKMSPSKFEEAKKFECIPAMRTAQVYYRDRNRTVAVGGMLPHGYPLPRGYHRNGYNGGYDTFDNVAGDSLRVRSHGVDYRLRSTGGNTANCPAPAKLHRTDMCRPTPDGKGVRCKFACY